MESVQNWKVDNLVTLYHWQPARLACYLQFNHRDISFCFSFQLVNGSPGFTHRSNAWEKIHCNKQVEPPIILNTFLCTSFFYMLHHWHKWCTLYSNQGLVSVLFTKQIRTTKQTFTTVQYLSVVILPHETHEYWSIFVEQQNSFLSFFCM